VPALIVCGAVLGVAFMPCPAFVWLEMAGGATDADMVVIPPTVCGTCGGAIIGSGCAVAFVVLIGMDWALWKVRLIVCDSGFIQKRGDYSLHSCLCMLFKN